MGLWKTLYQCCANTGLDCAEYFGRRLFGARRFVYLDAYGLYIRVPKVSLTDNEQNHWEPGKEDLVPRQPAFPWFAIDFIKGSAAAHER